MSSSTGLNVEDMQKSQENLKNIEKQEENLVEEQDDKINEAIELLKKAKRVVAFTGAGMSAESGIKTFRGTSSSLWSGFLGMFAMSIFGTPVGWNWISGISWKAYNNFFYSEIEKAKPNAGHFALAELEKKKKSDNFLVITQNVDGLHQAAGNSNVAELHGTTRKFKCVKHSHPYVFPKSQDASSGNVFSSKFKLPSSAPYCPQCGSRIRPDVVFFTESLPYDEFERAEEAISELKKHSNDVLLIIGTSASVYPAAGLPEKAAHRGIKIIEINVERTRFSDFPSALFIKGKVGDILPKITTSL